MNAETLKELLATTSPGPWAVEIDGPTWGWVEVKGPSFKVSGPTKATDLSYADKVRRENDSRLISLAPQLAADNIALQAEVERLDQISYDAAYQVSVLSRENAKLREALEEIASGDGVYGAQAHEYKTLARAALNT